MADHGTAAPPEVIRFRVLGDEHAKAKELATWRDCDDVSSYFRLLLERDWQLFQRSSARRAAGQRAA